MPHIPLLAWLIFSGPGSPVVDSIPTRATVWIRAGDRAVGTGWVADVKRGLIVTARHVVADREKVEVFFQDDRDGKPITDRVHYLSNRAELLKTGRVTTAEVVTKNDNADLAILRAQKIPAHVPELKLASHIPRVGHECYSIGHRHDAETLWCRTTGSIRQIGKLSEGYFWASRRLGVGIEVIQIQSPIELGESGAALLDSRNEVIGVISAVSNRTPALATAIGLGELNKLLAQARQDQRVVEEAQTVEKRPDVAALMHGTVWVRPQATEGRFAGVVVSREHDVVLTSASAIGTDDIVDIVVPKREKDRFVSELHEYRDLLGLRLSGHCVQGVVLARDLRRDLAIIKYFDRQGPGIKLSRNRDEIQIATELKAGDRVAAMSHPVGEELLWLYSQGTVRSIGSVLLRRDGRNDEAKAVACVLQLPHLGTSCGGPVVNEDGKFVGILAAKEGARQDLAYAATAAEIRDFLETTRPMWDPESRAHRYERAKYLMKRGRVREAGFGMGRIEETFGPKDTLIAAFCQRIFAEITDDFGDHESVRYALTYIEETLKRTPEVNAIMAEAWLLIGDKKNASRLVDAALKEDPKNVSALVSRTALGSGAEARGDIEKALGIDANYARAYVWRAALRDSNDPEFNEKTIADLTRAVELEPYSISIRSRRAAIYLAAKDYKKAASDFTRITELEPLKANWWLELANASFLAGDRTAARRYFVAAIRVDRKGELKVMSGIRQNGKALLDDNAADVERVAEWYASAIKEVLPYVGGNHKEFLTMFLAQAADQSDVRKRMELLALVLDDIVGAK